MICPEAEHRLPLKGLTGRSVILHVVGQVTDEVFSFLGPATRALARSNHSQMIVVVDQEALRHNVRRLEEYAALIRVPATGSPVRQWKDILAACKGQIEAHNFYAVHAHGLIPCLVASLALWWSDARPPIVYSPHGSRSLSALRSAGQLAMFAARHAVHSSKSSAIVTVNREARAAETWGITAVVESPVSDVFFSVQRREAEQPLIVTGGRDTNARSVEVFSQLAVLLNSEELGLGFNWLGTVSPDSSKRLAAAAVEIVAIGDDNACAGALSAGWMYVAPWSTRGFPVFLVQAMAAGLPCVARDCEQHREIIESGKTGFLCVSERDLVRQIAALVDDSDLRQRIGKAARAAAIERFCEAEFESRLLSAYATVSDYASLGKETEGAGVRKQGTLP